MVNFDYLYNPDAAKGIFSRNYFRDKKLSFNIIENGIMLPHKRITDTDDIKRRIWGAGGIVDGNGEFVKSSFAVGSRGEPYTPPPELIQKSNETVIYLGLFYPVWGHIITDDIRRLWFLKSEPFKQEFKNCPLVYIPWTRSSLERLPSFKRLLEILEVDVDRLQPITQPTQFEKIILPDESFSSGFTNEYRETIDRVRDFAMKNRTPTLSKKIYYYYGKHQVGEERLAEYFKSKGYDVIQPEKLTLDEQLNLLINCDSFASTLGSCAHNCVFLRDDMEIILILRSAKWFTGYQQILDQVHPLNINYVDSTLSIFNMNHDWECYIISEQLKKFFGDEFDGYEDGNFKTFLRYVKDSMIIKGRVPNPSQLRDYGKTFTDFMSQLKKHEDLITACNMPPRWETFQPTLTYQTHIHTKAWVAWQNEEQISGSEEDKLDIQAVKIKFPNHKVYYAVYYNAEEGWSKEVSNGEQAGTTDKHKSIYGIRIRLDEVGAKEFDILYRVHKFDGEWTLWAKNGEKLYSYRQKLNALQIKLEPKT